MIIDTGIPPEQRSIEWTDAPPSPRLCGAYSGNLDVARIASSEIAGQNPTIFIADTGTSPRVGRASLGGCGDVCSFYGFGRVNPLAAGIHRGDLAISNRMSSKGLTSDGSMAGGVIESTFAVSRCRQPSVSGFFASRSEMGAVEWAYLMLYERVCWRTLELSMKR